jgi:Flp pilus assembly protein CpaB
MPLFVSLGLAVLAAVLVYFFVSSMQPTVPVAVAQNNLSVGKKITPDDVAIKNYPKSIVSASNIKELDEAVGKTVAYGPILQGEAVRIEHLATSGTLLTALRTYAPAGWSAVELPPDTSLGMKGLRRGDIVDIYGEVAEGEKTVVKHIITVPKKTPNPSCSTLCVTRAKERPMPTNSIKPPTNNAI